MYNCAAFTGFDKLAGEVFLSALVRAFLPAQAGRQHDQRQAQRVSVLVQKPGHGKAIHLWHVDVENGQRERLAALDERQRFRSRCDSHRQHSPCTDLETQDLAVGLIVVDDEHALADELRLRSLREGCRTVGNQLELGSGAFDGEVDGRAFAQLTLDPHPSAHELAEAFADGQAEPGASILTGGRGIDLAEGTKQQRNLVGGNADAGIADGKVQLPRSGRELSCPRR